MKNLSVGDKIEIEKNSSTYDAYISEVSSMVDSETGLFKVKAQMDDTEEIAAGSTVKLKLVTDHVENSMLVPIDAIYYSNGNAYVYVYQDGIAVRTQVEVGLEDTEYAQIVSGLSGNELVVSTWSSNLYEGAKVRLKEDTDSQTESQEDSQTEPQTEQEA